ncbi:NAD(P)-dependent oxidoreductase [Peribacillus frigoritolerans]|uniref:NAD(P)-dependent oxidoreductase n=1 Tax=Peribacillus frigoritolerans TaxID=450367 RepID=UPI0020C17BE0|nr:NAD(P)-dependent oxidoreductase [Peribacillus frigoritolerans]
MKLLLTGAFKYNEEQINILKFLGYEIIFVQDERVPLQMDVSDIEAVVCNGLFLYNDINMFKNLKYIQLTSAGLDRVPLNYINEHGISLFSAKGVYSIPMAEWAVLKILEIYKKSRQFYLAQHDHKWEKQRDLLELTDKTAAIIGFGDVGTEIAKRLKVFGVNIIGVGRRQIDSDLLDEYYTIDDIDEVLRKSNIVILTLPFSEETYHLLDAKKIANMKDSCVLINVSRGGVIDEVALIDALKGNKFFGVALDVFEEEPLSKDNQLWDLDRVIVTPHNSFVSDKVNERVFELIMKNLKDYQGK